MTQQFKTTNDIAALFFAQRPNGGWLTEKQANWLYSQSVRESGRSGLEHGAKHAEGTYQGRRWTLIILPRQKAGTLKLWEEK